MKTPDPSSLRLTSTRDSLHKFQEYVSSLAGHLPATMATRIELVLEEVLVNLISYAYPDDQPGWIEVSCVRTPDRFVLRIIDSGRPFDPLGIAPPDLTLGVEEREIGGLGIHLVRQLTDRAEYERRGAENVVTLFWSLHE